MSRLVLTLLLVLTVGGVTASGADFTATTSSTSSFGAAADFNTVAVSLGNPGTPLANTVNLSATASSNRGVASVVFQAAPANTTDWVTLCTDNVAPYACAWNTTTIADDSYDVRATATDTAGYSRTSTVAARVVNNYILSVALSDPGPMSGNESLIATASNAEGGGLQSLKIQHRAPGAGSWTDVCSGTTNPRTCGLDTTALANGPRELRAVATDLAGHTAQSVMITRTVDNTPPTVTPSVPPSGSGTVAMNADAQDDGSGINYVAFEAYYLGQWYEFCRDTAAPYTCSGDSAAVPDGTYSIRVIVENGAGVRTTSSSSTITIDNTAPSGTDVQAGNGGVIETLRDRVPCRVVALFYEGLHAAVDPRLRSIATWNRRLLEDARRLDAVPAHRRGPLHCVPVVIKDNVDVAGLPTTGGVRALARSIPAVSAPVARRLLEAGALLLGKSNMPDVALNGINTVSSYGGQTVNPYDLSLTVYGSSGGSAAAISAGLGVIGIGTDTYGSLVQPASATGLVAIRPTQGLLSGAGILPLQTLQDVAGPMTRTVPAAALTLGLLTDAARAEAYARALRPGGLRGMTLGFDPLLLQALPMPPLAPSPEVVALFDGTLARLATAGATTRSVSALVALFPSLSAATDLSFQCQPVDFKQGLNAYLAALGPRAPVRTLSALIATGGYLASVDGFLRTAEAQPDSIETSPACQGYLAAKDAARAAMVAFMDAEGLDLLVYPAANQPPFPAGSAPPSGWFGFHGLSSVTGLPSLTMPMGIAPGTGAPVGFVLLARPNQEARLLQAAADFERRFHPRRPPLGLLGDADGPRSSHR